MRLIDWFIFLLKYLYTWKAGQWKVSFFYFCRLNTPMRSFIATKTLPLLFTANDSGYSIPLVINCWNCALSLNRTKRSLWESAINKWCVSGNTVIPRGLDNGWGKSGDVSLPKRWTNIPSSVNLCTHEPKNHYENEN